MKSFLRSLLMIGTFALLGAGCGGASAPNPESQLEPGTTVSSTPPVAIEPLRWDRTQTTGGVKFTSPEGYWVYYLSDLQTFYLVPGTPPEPGTADPRAEVLPQAVASFSDLVNDPNSFPTWERFVTTMAQFGCAEGTSEEDFIVCRDAPRNLTRGKTAGDFPYIKFSLSRVQQQTQAARGMRTYVSVQLGDGSNDGVLINVLDEQKADLALELAKSMKR